MEETLAETEEAIRCTVNQETVGVGGDGRSVTLLCKPGKRGRNHRRNFEESGDRNNGPLLLLPSLPLLLATFASICDVIILNKVFKNNKSSEINYKGYLVRKCANFPRRKAKLTKKAKINYNTMFLSRRF